MGTQGWIVVGLVGIAGAFFLRRFACKGEGSGCGCSSGGCCGKNKPKP